MQKLQDKYLITKEKKEQILIQIYKSHKRGRFSSLSSSISDPMVNQSSSHFSPINKLLKKKKNCKKF